MFGLYSLRYELYTPDTVACTDCYSIHNVCVFFDIIWYVANNHIGICSSIYRPRKSTAVERRVVVECWRGRPTMTYDIPDNKVEIEKTVTATDDRVTFQYQIKSISESVDRLCLVEQLSRPVDSTAIQFDTSDSGEWVYRPNGEVVFLLEETTQDALEAAFHVASETLSPADCVLTVRTATVPVGYQQEGEDHPTSDSHTPDSSEATKRVDTDGGTNTIRDSSPEKNTETPPTTGRSTQSITQSLPAVGLVAADSSDAVARGVYRATQNELPAYVAVEDAQGTMAQITRQLGGVVVTTADSDLEAIKQSLLQAVRTDSHRGMIFAEPGDDPIAFEESIEAFESSDQLVVEAVCKTDQTDILVGIPAYNEAETIGTVTESALTYADEVLVVDDGSTDRTAAVARSAGATVVEHERNSGYGSGLTTLFEEAENRSVEMLVILDGDNQHDTRDIPRLVDELDETNAEIAIGNRFGETATTEMPRYRQGGLWVINTMVNLSMGNLRPSSRIQDAQSGFRAYDETAIRTMVDHSSEIDDQMSASTDILQLANANGLEITEVPTTISYDVSNPSTRHPVTHGLSIVNRILTTLERNRPVTTFGIPGFSIALFGAGVGYWTVSNFANTGSIAAEGVVASVLLCLVGAIFVLISAVQHSLNVSLNRLDLNRT